MKLFHLKLFARLSRDVDAAPACLEDGSYRLCLTCHEPIESERLLADRAHRPRAHPADLVAVCPGDLERFCHGQPPADDVTVMVIRRER